MKNYIVAAIGEWNRELFEKRSDTLPGNWFFADNPEKLDELITDEVEPDCIFFIHWRWVVPLTVTGNFECICFHMTDLPFGRGGSPLQNLIVRGLHNTVLTALKMDEGIDSGPIYMKVPLSLAGSAATIYRRAAKLSWDMMLQIITNRPKPERQIGRITKFRRRVAAESEIPQSLSLEQIYDYIRMLDADGYPKAFLNVDSYRLVFEKAKLSNNEIVATVKIKLGDDL